MNLTELVLATEDQKKKEREYAAFGDNVLMIFRGEFLILSTKALGEKSVGL